MASCADDTTGPSTAPDHRQRNRGSEADRLVAALRRAAVDITAGRGIRDVDATLSGLLAAAVATVPGADGGGISRTERGVVSSSHPTDITIAELDHLQSLLAEGPCVTAADDPPDSGVVVAHDLAGDDAVRWPRFAPAAVAAGYRSLLSIGLSIRGPRHSVLNLYAREPRVFGPAARGDAAIFGLQAAALLHGAQSSAHFQVARRLSVVSALSQRRPLPRRGGRGRGRAVPGDGGRADGESRSRPRSRGTGTRRSSGWSTCGGLVRLPGGVLAPYASSTFGLGEVVRTALDAGAGRIVLGLGRSSCPDGGRCRRPSLDPRDPSVK
ncbi:glycerate kinase [Actinomycetospora sp. CA-084318]|uniref:GAF domain-containing protein n=1 Tax=Actinomycetospora sp. CA-084318 TaxID=3239892 RepID=UPI003D96AF26